MAGGPSVRAPWRKQSCRTRIMRQGPECNRGCCMCVFAYGQVGRHLAEQDGAVLGKVPEVSSGIRTVNGLLKLQSYGVIWQGTVCMQYVKVGHAESTDHHKSALAWTPSFWSRWHRSICDLQGRAFFPWGLACPHPPSWTLWNKGQQRRQMDAGASAGGWTMELG